MKKEKTKFRFGSGKKGGLGIAAQSFMSYIFLVIPHFVDDILKWTILQSFFF